MIFLLLMSTAFTITDWKRLEAGDELNAFLSRESGLKALDVEAARVIRACANTEIEIDEKAKVIDVCKAEREMREKARLEGMQEGRREGRREALCDVIKNVMESFQLTLEEAMKIMKVTTEDQEIIKKMI